MVAAAQDTAPEDGRWQTLKQAGGGKYWPGVWLFQITDDGLAAELTVKGTRYYRDKALD
jgi:hypothetical protein